MNAFEQELEDGLLSILLVDDVLDVRNCVIKMLAAVGTDWLVFSRDSLWQRPGSLQLQIRRIAEQPNRDCVDGQPTVWSQSVCLTEDGLRRVFAEEFKMTVQT